MNGIWVKPAADAAEALAGEALAAEALAVGLDPAAPGTVAVIDANSTFFSFVACASW